MMARLALLAAAGTALAASLSASPVANETLRAQGPHGDWRHAPAAAFYDGGEYYFEVGYAHVVALFNDVLAESRGEPSRIDDRAALLDEARELLKQALWRSPADAQAWAALALVSAMQGDEPTQTRALRRSWTLAPYSAAISPLRLMALAVAIPEDLGPETRDAIRRDVQVARRSKRGSVERLRQTVPQLDALIGSFEGA